MAKQALFSGLVADEFGNPVEVAYVGGESFYVIDDDGFKRHIETESVDRQVLQQLGKYIQGNEDLISEGTMKALGQEDIFTKAIIDHSLSDLDNQFEQLLKGGLPDDLRDWMGMLGFRVRIDMQGNVVEIKQPGVSDEGMDEGMK
ncbi:MAG: hypothetical protein IIA51_09145 [Chloroflexi bacterium]|nr:hypothetical protein [Chloroflexota bacterium]MCH8341704.1 hypothetical protein [Chloroflexota bacterium]MCI0771874.1 hypothetical protein [Chloroflexota bacterium]MCI0805596.1 hypothetical protein [Chloroflexota bacterium]MCI0826553.1 hypothetical protein [Chloroflexota bacterium]